MLLPTLAARPLLTRSSDREIDTSANSLEGNRCSKNLWNWIERLKVVDKYEEVPEVRPWNVGGSEAQNEVAVEGRVGQVALVGLAGKSTRVTPFSLRKVLVRSAILTDSQMWSAASVAATTRLRAKGLQSRASTRDCP